MNKSEMIKSILHLKKHGFDKKSAFSHLEEQMEIEIVMNMSNDKPYKYPKLTDAKIRLLNKLLADFYDQ